MGKIRKMIDYAVAIANDDSRGYSQTRRWPSQGTDFDCASLMYEAAYAAGYNVTVGPSGVHYTGTMIDDFRKAGFEVLEFDSTTSTLATSSCATRGARTVTPRCISATTSLSALMAPSTAPPTGNRATRRVTRYRWSVCMAIGTTCSCLRRKERLP